MKAIYIADDGKQFDDEYECERYEWLLKHPYLNNVRFYDKDGSVVVMIFAEESYEIVEKVIVPDKNALKDFMDFAVWTGFNAYESIDGVGDWVFDYDEGTFIKLEKKLFAYWGSVYGENVVGVTLAYDDTDAKSVLLSNYSDFESWDDYDIKLVEFEEDSVHEIYYGS